eukprot:9467987-Alexandrium_andersonii.AAC.1
MRGPSMLPLTMLPLSVWGVGWSAGGGMKFGTLGTSLRTATSGSVSGRSCSGVAGALSASAKSRGTSRRPRLTGGTSL